MTHKVIPQAVVGELGWTPTSITPTSGGYTPAARYIVRGDDKSAFVKLATTLHTASMLRREISNYSIIPPRLRPAFLGHGVIGQNPFLIIEDLSAADWPPPWTDNKVAAALSTMADLHELEIDLPTFADLGNDGPLGWAMVQSNPSSFLSLKLCSPQWLERALPALVEAEAACDTTGTTATHFDLRSDNICFVDGTAKLIDWNLACLSNPMLDLGFWLPSLEFEGGPPPETILPRAPEVAAWVSGYFASRAGQSDIPDAPFVRRVQKEQLSTALPWVQREMKLL